MQTLQGKIAVVTGASRGAGRGISLALGDAGATVYVTGRTVRGAVHDENLPGTVDDTAAEVSARGGVGIPVRCDHTMDADVEALFARVRDEQGRLDVLVNNVWGGYEHAPEGLAMGPFWTEPLERYWEGMFVAGLRAHFGASRLAVPLMLPRRVGLVVTTIAWAFDEYLGDLLYDVAKAAVVRMAQGMARELRPFGIASVALAPGFVRSERVLAAHKRHPFDLSATESPEYIGRAVAALAADPAVLERTGAVLTAGELARDYGFTDVDGTQPPPFRMPEGWSERLAEKHRQSVEAAETAPA